MTEWTKPFPFGDTWVVVRHDNTRRITQAGRRRITEQGAVRILERRDVTWTNQPTPSNPWTTT